LKEVEIKHDESSTAILGQAQRIQYYDIDPFMTANPTESAMNFTKSSLTRAVDLVFKPGSSKILLLRLLPRDAGEVRASNVLLKIQEKAFKFDMRIPLLERAPAPPWWLPVAETLRRQKLDLDQFCSLTVLPKPPKLRISLLRFPRTFYIDEMAEIRIYLQNEESDSADAKLSVSLSGGRDATPVLHMDPPPLDSETLSTTESAGSDTNSAIGEIPPGGTLERSVFFRAIAGAVELNLVVRTDYFLLSDPETPIMIQLKEKVHITAPFEVSYEFAPQIGVDPWPSYFVVDESDNPYQGLSQSWSAIAKATSFAVETLGIRNITLETTDIKFAARCITKAADNPPADVHVEPAQLTMRSFHIEAQKGDLEDRRSGLIGLQLQITWYRPEDSLKLTTTTLLVPALSIPFGEPRVLCTAHLVPGDPFLVNVTYRLENPSAHLLNFSVTMETSDEFAFTGPKAQLVQLVPLGRTDVKYTLIPFRQQAWIHPYLRVTDTGFGQELKVYASGGCRNEKKAIAIWVEGDSADE
jgi:trafficking protein particle complex subunit 11